MMPVLQSVPQLHLERPSRQWVDLFYDLAIAAGIIDLAGAYSRDTSLSGAIWLALTYAVLWCTWLLTSAASGSFRHAQRRHSLPTVVVLVAQMAVILFLAVASGDSRAEEAGIFDLLIGIALIGCLVLAVPSWRSGRLSGRVPLLVALAVAALAASYFVPGDSGLAVWAAAFVIVGAAVWAVASSAELDTHRVLHRLGELTVIVIGETLVKLVLAASEYSVAAVRVEALVPIFVVLAAIWWTYFAALSHTTVLGRAGRRAWIGLHLPLHLALLGISVGLSKVLIGASTLDKPFATLTLVSGPIVCAFATLAVLAIAARRVAASWMLGAGALVMAVLAVALQTALAPVPTAMVMAGASLIVAALATTTRQPVSPQD